MVKAAEKLEEERKEGRGEVEFDAAKSRNEERKKKRNSPVNQYDEPAV